MKKVFLSKAQLNTLWHNAKEEYPTAYLLLLGECDDGFELCVWHPDREDWDEFVEAHELKRWAYIDDLEYKKC